MSKMREKTFSPSLQGFEITEVDHSNPMSKIFQIFCG